MFVEDVARDEVGRRLAKTYLEHINNMIEQRKEEKKDPLWTKEKENFEYSQLFQSAPQCALPEVQDAQQSIVRFRDKRGNPQHPDHDTEKAHFEVLPIVKTKNGVF